MEKAKMDAMKEKYLEELKKLGIDQGEEGLRKVIKLAFDFGEEYIVTSESKSDDIALPFLPMAEKVLVGLADTLDGEKDEE